MTPRVVPYLATLRSYRRTGPEHLASARELTSVSFRLRRRGHAYTQLPAGQEYHLGRKQRRRHARFRIRKQPGSHTWYLSSTSMPALTCGWATFRCRPQQAHRPCPCEEGSKVSDVSHCVEAEHQLALDSPQGLYTIYDTTASFRLDYHYIDISTVPPQSLTLSRLFFYLPGHSFAVVVLPSIIHIVLHSYFKRS